MKNRRRRANDEVREINMNLALIVLDFYDINLVIHKYITYTLNGTLNI